MAWYETGCKLLPEPKLTQAQCHHITAAGDRLGILRQGPGTNDGRFAWSCYPYSSWLLDMITQPREMSHPCENETSTQSLKYGTNAGKVIRPDHIFLDQEWWPSTYTNTGCMYKIGDFHWIRGIILYFVMHRMIYSPHPDDALHRVVFKNTYELLNLRALKFSLVNKIYIFQCMGKIFCVEFQRYPHKISCPYIERYDF